MILIVVSSNVSSISYNGNNCYVHAFVPTQITSRRQLTTTTTTLTTTTTTTLQLTSKMADEYDHLLEQDQPDVWSQQYHLHHRPPYMPPELLPSPSNLVKSATQRLSRLEIQQAITDLKRFIEHRLETDLHLTKVRMMPNKKIRRARDTQSHRSPTLSPVPGPTLFIVSITIILTFTTDNYLVSSQPTSSLYRSTLHRSHS